MLKRLHFFQTSLQHGVLLLGFLLKKAGIFGVKRGKADIGAVKMAMKCLKNGERLLMFPEGTRHQDGDMRDAKTGCAMVAVRTGVPIVPVYVPMEKKWFRFTKVVFGEPYYPQFEGVKANAEDYRIISDDLLERIRALEVQSL